MPGGRPPNAEVELLKFKLKRQVINGVLKYKALCLECKTELSNTSKCRLQVHRNICKKANLSKMLKKVASDRNICRQTPNVSQHIFGRKQQNIDLLSFQLKRVFINGVLKYRAECLVCKTELTNTSIKRLQTHRGVCKEKAEKELQPVVTNTRKIPDPVKVAGRKQNKGFKYLNFKLKRLLVNGKRKYKALCLVCNNELTNTAENRLLQHRNICHINETTILPKDEVTTDNGSFDNFGGGFHSMGTDSLPALSTEVSEVPEGASKKIKVRDIEELIGHPRIEIEYTDVGGTSRITQKDLPATPSHANTTTKIASRSSIKEIKALSKSELPKIVFKGQIKSYLIKRKVNKHVNTAVNEEDKKIEDAIANFLIECNLPCSIIESDHFKNFIRALRPDFGDRLFGKQE